MSPTTNHQQLTTTWPLGQAFSIASCQRSSAPQITRPRAHNSPTNHHCSPSPQTFTLSPTLHLHLLSTPIPPPPRQSQPLATPVSALTASPPRDAAPQSTPFAPIRLYRSYSTLISHSTLHLHLFPTPNSSLPHPRPVNHNLSLRPQLSTVPLEPFHAFLCRHFLLPPYGQIPLIPTKPSV